jgi:hypothetical protein
VSNFDCKTKQYILASTKPLTTLMHTLWEQGSCEQTNKEAIVELIQSTLLGFMIENMRDALRICCFSEDSSSILMWSHYADHHRGFVIEYETGSYSDEARSSLFPVDYRGQLPSTDDIYLHRAKANLYWKVAAACMKASAWAYECEWRLIDWSTDSAGKFKGSAHPIPMPKPTRVLLGAKMELRTQRLIEHVCKAKSIDCLLMKLDRTGFRFAATPDVEHV